MRRNQLTNLLGAAALVALVFHSSACDSNKPAGGDEKVAKAEEGATPPTAEAGDSPGADEGDADGGGDEAEMPDPSTPEGKVALAAKVAGAIASEPASADEILAENGLDRDKLDELMYEIATDPNMREEYAVAFAEARSTG